jgi:hypothetical protein
MESKPRRANVKLTRTVTEIAIVLLDKEGNVEEYEELQEELNYDGCIVTDIRTVLSVHS